MLRIVPTNAEELQKVQELQDLEELQVPGGFWGTAPLATCFAPPKPHCRAGMGLEVGRSWCRGAAQGWI